MTDLELTTTRRLRFTQVFNTKSGRLAASAGSRVPHPNNAETVISRVASRPFLLLPTDILVSPQGRANPFSNRRWKLTPYAGSYRTAIGH